MSGIPQELIVVVIAGALLLSQFILGRLRTKIAPMPLETAAPVMVADMPAVVEEPVVTVVKQPLPGLESWGAPPIRSARDLRRFSRTALMNDRRAVQDAIVIGAILRPCHAHRPHGVD